ncbi:MAG: MATE family efflux transporter [Desulfobacterales bacterium]
MSTRADVVRVSLPLVVGMSTTLVMTFTDRIFLANYSLDAIAAAMPAGIVVFLFYNFLADTAGYINVFIAQYTGAGAEERVGRALWQGIYFAILAWVPMLLLSLLAVPLFRLGGHAPEVQELEVIYFRVLCYGAGLPVLSTALSCFFTGRGVTRPVMMIHGAGMCFNIPLDYALINGIGPFPEWGVKGAAVATVCAYGVMALLLGILVFSRQHDRVYGVRRQRQFDGRLFRRILRFGLPASLQFSVDVLAFAFFIFMVGRLGKTELAVTNIAIALEGIAFRPLMGFALGTTTLVGLALGKNRPDKALAAAKATLGITIPFFGLVMLLFLFFPHPLIMLFKPRNLTPQEFALVLEMGTLALRFIAFYLVFDAFYMISTAVLKGAGDTRFIFLSCLAVSLCTMIIPLYVGLEIFEAGFYYAWGCVVAFAIMLAVVSVGRVWQGNWKAMRVVESDVF